MSVLSRTARPSRVRIKREDGFWWVLSPWQPAESRLSWRDALASAEVILRQREDVAKHPENLADRVSDLVAWGWSFKQLREQTGIQLEDLVTLQHSPYSRCRELRIPKRQEAKMLELYRKECAK